MAQNIYDNDSFFEAYACLRRSKEGLDGAPEWPVLQALLPDLHGKRVLDLGCGFGWFCRAARALGASEIVGLDVSENMLARARATTSDPAIRYGHADLDTVELPPGAYDVVYSSLTLHYIADLARLMAQVHSTLVPGGRLVFSCEHPMFTAPSEPKFLDTPSGRRVWPIDRYLSEGPRTTDWLAPGVVKQHRTVGTYVTTLAQQGFVVKHLQDWGPTEAQVAENPGWADERQRPAFLLVAATRP
jgi:SAM-dependent methyltransferase